VASAIQMLAVNQKLSTSAVSLVVERCL